MTILSFSFWLINFLFMMINVFKANIKNISLIHYSLNFTLLFLYLFHSFYKNQIKYYFQMKLKNNKKKQ